MSVIAECPISTCDWKLEDDPELGAVPLELGVAESEPGEPGDVRVDIRGREVPVRIVKFPFVREGAVLVDAA